MRAALPATSDNNEAAHFADLLGPLGSSPPRRSRILFEPAQEPQWLGSAYRLVWGLLLPDDDHLDQSADHPGDDAERTEDGRDEGCVDGHELGALLQRLGSGTPLL